MAKQFWKNARLDALSPRQWESLCDGCGRCCLHKLEDEDSGEFYYTNVACRLLDPDTCRCRDYVQRKTRVPDCITLTIDSLADPAWLPSTCAYRLLAEGKPLPAWHPLVSGDPDSVLRAGHSARGRVIPETDAGTDADDLLQHLVDWAG